LVVEAEVFGLSEVDGLVEDLNLIFDEDLNFASQST
jgi:hypothetical protein